MLTLLTTIKYNIQQKILFYKMCLLEDLILNLQEFLINDKSKDYNIIRKHTKKLDELGDISFPLNISNWYQFLGSNIDKNPKLYSILDYKFPQLNKESVVNELIEKSLLWNTELKSVTFKNNDAHLFIKRSSTLYQNVIKEVLDLNEKYGSCNIISQVGLKFCQTVENNVENKDLTILRLVLLKGVAKNLVDFTCSNLANDESIVYFITNPVENYCKNVICGPVLNENGVKSSCTAEELYNKRSSDMRMMAQHKYGVQVKPNLAWENYFHNLGKNAVTIEMLTNKPQKAIKISPHDLQSSNKGASFIFYNCARLETLFKEFDRKILRKEYPELPNIDNIDFSSLNQPEEWELFYVYILQFPMVIKSCIRDIKKGIFNPQHLISFLSNLCSIFSVYYRRVRILTSPKEHMFSVIHAKIYLLKALQCVFHNALHLLNIEPVKEM